MKSGKLKEIAVTILERHLDDKAVVKQNVFLPVLEDESRRPRECDVVIFESEDPVVIFEVQDRGKKPTIGEFDGWLIKMEEVGVQHLVCVSRVGFPGSIKKKAEKVGPSVRLLTLKELERNEWPIPTSYLDSEMVVVRYDKMTDRQILYPHLVRQNPNPTLDPFEKMFKLADGRLLSSSDLVDYCLFSDTSDLKNIPLNKSTHLTVVFNNQAPGGNIQCRHYGGKWFIPENVRIGIWVFKTTRTITWKTEGYQQLGHGKELAWVVMGQSISNEEPVKIIAPLTRAAPGRYTMGIPSIIGNPDVFISLGSKGYPTKHYTDGK